MELILNIGNFTKDLAKTINIYLDKLEHTGFSGVEPFLTDKIRTSTAAIMESTGLVTFVNAVGDGFEKSFSIFGILWEDHYHLTEAYKIFIKYKIDPTREGSRTSSGITLSSTYLKELNESLENLDLAFGKYNNEINNSEITTYLLAGCNINSVAEVIKVRKIYLKWLENNKGQYVIDLYINLLQKTIDDVLGDPAGKLIIKQIIKDIEDLKTGILLGAVDENISLSAINKNANTVQRLIQRFSLSPDGPARPLMQLLSELVPGSKSPASIAKMLSNKEKKFGFITIYKITNKPISHNLWTLIDEEYLKKHNLVQERTLGINAKSLERGRTIDVLTAETMNKKDTNRIEFITDNFGEEIAMNYYYVIETLDGTNWRFLVPWHTEIKYIPASWLDNISDIKQTPSRRLASYNHIIGQEIIKHLQKPFVTVPELSREEVQKEETHWNVLRSKVKSEIMELIGAKIRKANTTKALETILNNASLYKQIITMITNQISVAELKDNQNNEKIDQWQAELILSYFRDIDKIQKSFKHDVLETYHKDYATKVEEYIKRNEMARLVKVVEEIYEIVLAKYISRRNNIYLSISKKAEMLSKTLFLFD